ncbi:MAG: molybdenum cofactor biosynthesis protein MoaE, partial [Candidatus Nanopelagicales bacterium]
MTEVRADISSTPIEVTGHEEFVARPHCGAVVSFAGVVRDHDDGRNVMGLEYSAHPSAEEVLAQVVQLAVSRWRLGGIAVTH